MYSNKRNILQLVALLHAHGVNHAVLCPGSRNAPIVKTMVASGFFQCHAAADERDAGFFANGLSVSNEEPVAVCCTSGSALLNIAPAVAEAFYQKTPLVVVSADRPAAWIGQMDGQTLPQPGVFGSLVRMSVDVAEVRDEEDEWFCNRQINEALLATAHHGLGPVHINVRVGEPLFEFSASSLPQPRVITRYQGLNVYDRDYNALIDRLNGFARKMIVVGQMNLIYLFEKRYVKQLYKHFVWLAEHVSNRTVPGLPIKNFDAALAAMTDAEREQMHPDLLITYGGHVMSKRLKCYFRAHPPKEHWHISESGEICDVFCCLTTVVEMSPFEFLEKIAALLENRTPDFPRIWESYCKRIPVPAFGYSEMAAVGKLMEQLPQACALHLGNSSAVRYAQLFPLPDGVEVCSNRGVNGIDGSLSTALGYAAADSAKLNFIVLGDLSFFYDMNALWNKQIGGNVRILLLNNGGGEIFGMLPGLDLTDGTDRFVAGKHAVDAKGWAESCGFDYRSVRNGQQLDEAIGRMVSAPLDAEPLLVEVFTDAGEDLRLLNEYYNSLKH